MLRETTTTRGPSLTDCVAAAMLRARDRASLSQHGAAAASGANRGSIADYETGRQLPPLAALASIAKAYGTTASAILAEAEDLFKRFSE